MKGAQTIERGPQSGQHRAIKTEMITQLRAAESHGMKYTETNRPLHLLNEGVSDGIDGYVAVLEKLRRRDELDNESAMIVTCRGAPRHESLIRRGKAHAGVMSTGDEYFEVVRRHLGPYAA